MVNDIYDLSLKLHNLYILCLDSVKPAIISFIKDKNCNKKELEEYLDILLDNPLDEEEYGRKYEKI